MLADQVAPLVCSGSSSEHGRPVLGRRQLTGRRSVEPQVHSPLVQRGDRRPPPRSGRFSSASWISRPWKMSSSGALRTLATIPTCSRRWSTREPPRRAPGRRSAGPRPSHGKDTAIPRVRPRPGLPARHLGGGSRHSARGRGARASLRSPARPASAPPGSASGRLGQCPSERLGHEHVGLLAQREGARLAGAAHDSPAGPGEADQVLARPAAGARAELGREAGGEQQLQAERERPASPVAPVDPARSSSSASWRQSRLKHAGWGSEVSNRRPTASQAREAPSSARGVAAQSRDGRRPCARP